MIRSFVAEGRTVVLSSHLLDEVERTCDAVAIVDRGNIIRQGPINELLSGSDMEVNIECSTPEAARQLLAGTNLGGHIEVEADGLTMSLAAGSDRSVVAEINRLLVDADFSVYRLELNQASLESWFLEVTTRLGAPE
jgi:ABC-2 type transport system ATP-binding protein